MLLEALPSIADVTCEVTYENETKRVVERRIILKCVPDAAAAQ